jgi:hypothetical protein
LEKLLGSAVRVPKIVLVLRALGARLGMDPKSIDTLLNQGP